MRRQREQLALQFGMREEEEVQQQREQARITTGMEKGEGKQQRKGREELRERMKHRGEGNRWLGTGEEHWG